MDAPPAFDRALLSRLADLARLHVPAERQAQVLGSMQRVVDAFDALRQVGEPDLTHAPDAPLRLRVDRADATLSQDEVLANTRQAAAGMFLVPRVVDG